MSRTGFTAGLSLNESVNPAVNPDGFTGDVTMADKASDNTKAILQDNLRLQLKAFDPALAAMKAELATLAGSTAIGAAQQLAEKATKVAEASKIKADAERILAGDATSATGTRNTTGGAIKRVKAFTGRDMLAEAAAAYDAAVAAAAVKSTPPKAAAAVKSTPPKAADTTGAKARK